MAGSAKLVGRLFPSWRVGTRASMTPEQEQEMRDGFIALADAVTKMVRSALDAVTEVAVWYEAHKVEVDAFLMTPEAERAKLSAVPDGCHCLCGRWHTLGNCEGEATGTVVFPWSKEPIPMCGWCGMVAVRKGAAYERLFAEPVG